MSYRSNQKGFAVIETLLIVIILALIGFIGWYVWHAHQDSTKPLAGSTTGVQSASKSQATSSGINTKSELVISEWGISLPYTSQGQATLLYRIDPSSPNIALLDTSELVRAYPQTCDLMNGSNPIDASVGSIQRGKPAEIVDSAEVPDGTKFQDILNDDAGRSQGHHEAMQKNGYVYMYVPPQQACSLDTSHPLQQQAEAAGLSVFNQ